MPTPKLIDEECLRAVEAIRRPPYTQTAGARSMGLSRSAFQARLNKAVDRGFCTADEAIGNNPKTSYKSAREAAERQIANEQTPPPVPVDPVEVRRLKDGFEEMKRQRDAAVRRAIEAEDLRSGILGLGPPKKAAIKALTDREAKGKRTVLVHLSDIHYGEYVDLNEMDGLNSYSPEIADRRLALLFDKVCRLLTEHWKGKPPDKLILCLGGDMISGGIHLELAKTDSLTRLPSCRDVGSRIAEGIHSIRKRVGCPVDVYSVPGNHGRLSLKPESKAAAVDSFDTLVAWFVERDVSHDKGVTVYYSDSIDALFTVYGRPFLLTHGDRMGSRGGQGFVGVAAPIARGHQKLHADYANRGIILYRILTAHLHTALSLSLGDANGSLIGWSQYPRDLRAKAEPASQNMTVVHSEAGIIDWRKIMPGSPDEGSIYRGAV